MLVFAVGQGAKSLGLPSLTLSSVQAELDATTLSTGQGHSAFNNGGNSLSPLHLPQGMVTVLLRPFPWEVQGALQELASLEGVALAAFIVWRRKSLAISLRHLRSVPFLFYCWTLTILYAVTFQAFANFGLLDRQRSLVLPALYVLLCLDSKKAREYDEEQNDAGAARDRVRGPCRALARFFRRTLKVASAAADRWRPHVDGVVILLYHRVGGGTSLEVDLDAARFDEQMATVAASRRPVTLGAALDELAAPESPHAPPPVVVTFDDGTADFVDVAVPILVRHQVPATLYLATAFVEEGREFPGGGRPLSWSALRDACSTGLVDIGSHTHTHALLDRAAPGAAADELDRSVDLIGANLGVTARDFAYPKAVAGTPEVAELVRERFRSAALAGTRVNAYPNEPIRTVSRVRRSR